MEGHSHFNCPHSRASAPSVPHPQRRQAPEQSHNGILLNIIICVIQHFPFIFYLFFWLGNLGSSPESLQKPFSTRRLLLQPPSSPCSPRQEDSMTYEVTAHTPPGPELLGNAGTTLPQPSSGPPQGTEIDLIESTSGSSPSLFLEVL